MLLSLLYRIVLIVLCCTLIIDCAGPWSDEYRDFLKQCLQHDPNSRGTTSQLLQHPFLSQAKPDDPEILEDGPIEELEAIVNGLYTHLKSIRTEMNADHNHSVTASVKRNYNMLSIYEMAHRILFGEPPTGSNNNNRSSNNADDSDSSPKGSLGPGCERMSALAHQLHLDCGLATQVAKDVLNDLRLDDETSTHDCNIPTPKAIHC